MTTYILGNGFDIAHDLDTSFESFRNYLEEKQSNLLYLFDGDNYWSDFEKNICAINHENYKTIQGMFKGIPSFVNSLFDDLCDELLLFLNKNNYKCKKLFSFEKKDVFINFNYTHTLVETYDIDVDNIYHIHGSIMGKKLGINDKLVLGHDESDYETNPNLVSGKFSQEYTEFVYYTEKPYKSIIKSNIFQSFMNKIKNSERIVVYGLSYGTVDMNYLKYIFNNINKSTKVIFYYFSVEDLAKLNIFLKGNAKDLIIEKKCCKGEKFNEEEL